MPTERLTRIFTASATQQLGETVEVRGWVFRLRALASTTFIVLRDCTGTIQCVCATASFKGPHVKLDDVSRSSAAFARRRARSPDARSTSRS